VEAEDEEDESDADCVVVEEEDELADDDASLVAAACRAASAMRCASINCSRASLIAWAESLSVGAAVAAGGLAAGAVWSSAREVPVKQSRAKRQLVAEIFIAGT
jgi:F0F1-type ATP synthase membrane subunit c/vacuolar-type H+-ATPase subunit K